MGEGYFFAAEVCAVDFVHWDPCLDGGLYTGRGRECTKSLRNDPSSAQSPTLYTADPVWAGVCTLGFSARSGFVHWRPCLGGGLYTGRGRECTKSLRNDPSSAQSPTLYTADPVWKGLCTLGFSGRAALRRGPRAAPRAGRTPAPTRPARRKPRSRTRGTPRACSLLPSWPRVLSLFASLPYECAAGAGRGAMSRHVSGGVRTSREDRADANSQHVTRRRDMA